MNTFAFRPSTDARHSYFVLLHTEAPPDTELWSQYVAGAVRGARMALARSDGRAPPVKAK